MSNPARQVLSDLELALLIYHDGWLADATPEQVADARRSLQDKQLLHFPMDGDDHEESLPLTVRGEVHLEHLLHEELPTRIWSHR